MQIELPRLKYEARTPVYFTKNGATIKGTISPMSATCEVTIMYGEAQPPSEYLYYVFTEYGTVMRVKESELILDNG